MPQRNPMAVRIARKVMKYASITFSPIEMGMGCLNCGLLPISPVTGFCGHTRCTPCIEKHKSCPCGSPSPEKLHVNVRLNHLIGKMKANHKERFALPVRIPTGPLKPSDNALVAGPTPPDGFVPVRGMEFFNRQSELTATEDRGIVNTKVRMGHAQHLLTMGALNGGAVHLAYVAAGTTHRTQALDLLIEVVTIMLRSCPPHRLTRQLYQGIRGNCLLSNLESSDFECNICFEVMWKPITTYCGHTFCRGCLFRALHERRHCPLCCSELDKYDIILSKETTFIPTALAALNIYPLSPPNPMTESQYIPIFKCTVAYPAIPCPMMFFGPYEWTFIRRLLDSGNRRFGMVATCRDGSLATYGTMVEIRDCVHFEDGQTILSTVGMSRFKVMQTSFGDEGIIAQVKPIHDAPMSEEDYNKLHLERLAQIVTEKVFNWLSTLNLDTLVQIEDTFGEMPEFTYEPLWWQNPDSHKWLWWIIAIMPFSTELQVLMISTVYLHKRMLAVSHTLDVIKNCGLSPNIRVS